MCVTSDYLVITVFPFREELKRERISAVLQESVTTSYRLRVRMGRVVYFEHPFTNSQTNPLTVSVAWNDPELKWVYWRNFRGAFKFCCFRGLATLFHIKRNWVLPQIKVKCIEMLSYPCDRRRHCCCDWASAKYLQECLQYLNVHSVAL